MEGEWTTFRLGDVCSKIGSGATPRGGSSVYLDHGDVALIRSQNIYNDGFHHDGIAYLTTEHAEGLANVEVAKHDVLLNITGDSVARSCQVDADVIPARVNQHVAIIRPDPTVLWPRFLRYFLVSPAMQAHMLSLAGAGATRNALTKRMIESFEVQAPNNVEEQHAIAYILGTLDDKIELNRRMNETLEAMARALFKSWFVDFDPVHAKAEGRDPGLPKPLADLFPDSFEDSELGEIPKGWHVVSLGDICRRVAMGPFGSDIKTDNFIDSGVPVVRGSNLTNGFVEDSFAYVSEQKADQLRNANAYPDDIVITHRGTLGQVGLIPEQSRFPRYVVSQSQMLLSVNKDVVTSRYVYDFLLSPIGQHALLANTSQTGVPAIARPTSSMRAIQLLLPPLEVLTQFNGIVEPVHGRRDHNVAENRTLAALRDTMLPKLISGELRISIDENAVEAIL